jgi:hypothetical protein
MNRIIRLCTALALVYFAAASAPVRAAEIQRSARDKLEGTAWKAVRGVNFIPSYASNTYEIWREYNSTVFDRELRLARAVGYNSVRLWLNYAVYEELGEAMVDRVEDALRLCARHQLHAVVVLFDSCGVRPRPDARWITKSEAYDLFQASPRFTPEQKQLMEQLFARYAKGFGSKVLVPVGADSPMMTLLWENWQPTPGNDRLGPESYLRLERYVGALLSRLQDHPQILLWDLMNEPEFASEGPLAPGLFITSEMERIRDAFLQRFRNYLKQQYPEELVGIGWASLENCEKYADLADVLTFHVYRGPEDLQRTLDRAAAFGRQVGKPILVTETLANWNFGSPDFGSLASDEAQLAHYQQVLPVLAKSPVGWMAWGFVISRVFSAFCDIFYPDGHPRPAAIYLEKTLRENPVGLPRPSQAEQK